MAVWQLLAYGRGDPRIQLDAIRAAGTVVVGTGGAAALLLAARRQQVDPRRWFAGLLQQLMRQAGVPSGRVLAESTALNNRRPDSARCARYRRTHLSHCPHPVTQWPGSSRPTTRRGGARPP